MPVISQRFLSRERLTALRLKAEQKRQAAAKKKEEKAQKKTRF